MKRVLQSIWNFLMVWSEELAAYRRSNKRNYY
jgi:hypothetical protein